MELRASDADREQAVERLRVAAMDGRLDSEELEARIQSAYAARFCGELAQLTLDVTPPPAPVGVPAAPPARPVFVQTSRSTNGFAIASLICSVGWFLWFGSLAAVIFGHVALNQIRASGGEQGGRGLAIGGLIIGYAGIAAFTLAVLVSLLA